MIFDITPNPVIIFGEGAVLRTGKRMKEMGCKKVICITDKGIKNAGILEKVAENVRNAGLEVVEFDGVLPDPPDYKIEGCAELAREEGIDSVIGLGGGSSMDTAKCVNILLTNPSPISQYYGPSGVQKETALVLIPTTAGTGSELSIVSVVTDIENKRKSGCVGPAFLPDLAIIDPELTLGLPPAITACTGMDAFSHSAEAITSGVANPVADMEAEKAISLICNNLPRVVKDGSNIEARTGMSLAASLGGVSGIKDSMVHFGHSLAHTMGSMYHNVPHGVFCALVIPEVIRDNAQVVPEKVKLIGEAMGLEMADNMSPREIGDKVAGAIKDLNNEIGIPSIEEIGIDESAIKDIVKIAYQDETAIFAPEKLSYDHALKILMRVFEG